MPRGIKKIVANSTAPVAQNSVPKAVAAVFLAVILVVSLSTHKSITDSAALCSAYQECVVFAHQWKASDGYCPCVILIDVDLAPKTYHEWLNALAGAGMLTSLQVVNRQLVALPEEIRKCSGLRTIQLIYTDTHRVPVWAKDLRYLETIHIEGRYDDQNLLDLPDDLFADMPHLSMIRLGIQLNLKKLPSLAGVPNLQSLSLAWTTQLNELPSSSAYRS